MAIHVLELPGVAYQFPSWHLLTVFFFAGQTSASSHPNKTQRRRHVQHHPLCQWHPQARGDAPLYHVHQEGQEVHQQSGSWWCNKYRWWP